MTLTLPYTIMFQDSNSNIVDNCVKHANLDTIDSNTCRSIASLNSKIVSNYILSGLRAINLILYNLIFQDSDSASLRSDIVSSCLQI